MDIKYKSEFEFLDLSGLDDSERGEINVALNSGTATEVLQLPWDTGEIDYYEPDVVSLEHDENQSWQNYEPEHSQVSYESEIEGPGVGVMSPMASAHVYSHPPPSIMTTVYGGMMTLAQPNIYELGPDMSMAPYVQGEYQQSPIYIQATEIHDVSMNRDNRRRSHRGGRGNKRETNNRYMDSNNEMGGGAGAYHSAPGQYRIPRNVYPPPQTFYYHPPTAEHQNSQRQRSYLANAPYSQPIPRPVYAPLYSSVSNQYPRHTQVSQSARPRHEIPKQNVKRVNESSPRPQASNYGPPPLSIQRKTTTEGLSNNSSQTNIDCVTTVIVNNSKIEHSVKNNNLNEGESGVGSGEFNAATTTTKYSSTTTTTNSSNNVNNKIINNSDNSNSNISNSNKVPPVNVTIEHNIVATVNNKSCEISEKADNGGVVGAAGPYVNINSSIQVKQKTESNIELRKETVSLVQSQTSPSLQIETKNLVEDEAPKEEAAKELDTKEVIVVESKEPEIEVNLTLPTVSSPTITTPLTSTTITMTTRPATESSSSMSWASILKKSNNDPTPSGISNGKPMARIIPLRIDVSENQSDNISNKSNFSPNEAPGTKQTQGKPRAFSNADNTVNNESNASNRNDVGQEEYDSSNKFNDLDAHKTGEFLLKYQMEKQTVSLLPRGLINRNNYCYINSILQALLACPPFYNLLIALPYSKTASRNSTSNNLTTNMIRFVNEFSPLSAGARLQRKERAQKRSDEAVVNVQSGIAFEPSYVYTMLKNTSCASVFSVEGRQEDAEEFLSCLLNGISDEMLEMMKLANNENPPIPTEAEPVQSNNAGEQEEWKIMGPKNKGSITRCTDFGRTPLSDIFRGQLRYRVSRAGEQSTDNVQPFFTLQLDIEKAESVKGALEILVGRDQLEGMTCSKTKREIEAWKQVTLEELPVILILHLKWFDYKLDGCSKILKSVEFPIDLKIDGKILSTNTSKKLSPKQKQYKLFAVTYHDGKEATKGHYVTDAFHVGYGGWVRYDDSSLRGVSENNVLNPLPPRVPYLLYYRRCDTIGNNNLNNDRIR